MNPAKFTLTDRLKGCLLGLAVADAWGSFYEGQSPDWISRRFDSPQELLSNQPRSPWYYTDDTQMAIGVSEALLEDGFIHEVTLCKKFTENYQPNRGYGRGARVLLQAMIDGDDHKTLAREYFPGGSYGNGAAMRVATIGLCFANDREAVLEEAKKSSLPTHTHPLGIEGAQLLARAVQIAAFGEPFHREHFFEQLIADARSEEYRDRLSSAVRATSREELLRLGNGIEALESVVTAITCFACWPDSYEELVANVIFLGGDTDTIAAMAGAICGTRLGISGIPTSLLDKLENEEKGRGYLETLAEDLGRKFD